MTDELARAKEDKTYIPDHLLYTECALSKWETNCCVHLHGHDIVAKQHSRYSTITNHKHWIIYYKGILKHYEDNSS